MAKFIFKLENILQIKYKLEEQRKIEFSIAMGRLNDAIDELEQLYNRRYYYEEELRALTREGAKAIELREASYAVEIIKVKIIDQTEVVRIEEHNVEIARENLNISMQERKTYEILKEKEFERFKQEVNATEMKEVDELVSYKFGVAAEG